MNIRQPSEHYGAIMKALEDGYGAICGHVARCGGFVDIQTARHGVDGSALTACALHRPDAAASAERFLILALRMESGVLEAYMIPKHGYEFAGVTDREKTRDDTAETYASRGSRGFWADIRTIAAYEQAVTGILRILDGFWTYPDIMNDIYLVEMPYGRLTSLLADFRWGCRIMCGTGRTNDAPAAVHATPEGETLYSIYIENLSEPGRMPSPGSTVRAYAFVRDRQDGEENAAERKQHLPCAETAVLAAAVLAVAATLLLA